MDKNEIMIDTFNSIESLIQTFYDVISGTVDKERDWNKMRPLFIPGARLVPNSVVCGSLQLTAIDIDVYIQNLIGFLNRSDFYEIGLIHHIEEYGNMASVTSTYHARYFPDQSAPCKQGVNFIHLVNDGNRWWITGMIWKDASPNHPIHEKYHRTPSPN